MDGLLPRRFFALPLAVLMAVGAVFAAQRGRFGDERACTLDARRRRIARRHLHPMPSTVGQWATVASSGHRKRRPIVGADPLGRRPNTLRSVHFNNAGQRLGSRRSNGARTSPHDQRSLAAHFRWRPPLGRPTRDCCSPQIHAVKFFGPQQGWAVTPALGPVPLGRVLHRQRGADRGRPLADREPADWSVADFADPLAAAIAGGHSARAAVSARKLE